MSDGVKHVYILGAGFSLPLGGPLFNELLTDRLGTRLRPFFEHCSWPTAEKRVIESFPKVIHQSLGELSNNNINGLNAEQILELAESMASANVHVNDLRDNEDCGLNWLARSLFQVAYAASSGYLENEKRTSSEIYRLLKVRLALETSEFLQTCDKKSERWDPYRKWYNSLGPSDYILTTNYDLVLERLEQLYSEKNSGNPVADRAARFAAINRANGPIVAKLHGSCNWYFSDGAIEKVYNFDRRDLVCRDIAIGMPGNGKSDLASSHLRSSWSMAQRELAHADVISIVGYSLPETDNRLRMLLLDSISENEKLQAVNIILGTRNERGLRAKSIIKQCLLDRDRTKVSLPPVYAQDFLPYYRPKTIQEIKSLAFEE